MKKYGYRYFARPPKAKIFKFFTAANAFLLILQMSFGGLLFLGLPLRPAQAVVAPPNNLCYSDLDVMLVMDRSGSMADTSRCIWWNTIKNKWETEYNKTYSYCLYRNQPSPHQSKFTVYNPTKFVSAKSAGNYFLSLLGAQDQSALVSFADDAAVNKTLDYNHPGTQSAVSALTALGATNIGDGIGFGINELNSGRGRAQAVKTIILLTDGMANKPSGPGYGEWPADVTYAVNKAALAVSYGIVIFTIGLGDNGEINESMLQNIANTTGGQYFHAPSQTDLQAIYNSIAQRLCELGSISGCKYEDTDQDGDLLDETNKLAGWTIQLNNSDHQVQETDASGCYKFSGLNPGVYTITELDQAGVPYKQTFPTTMTYSINLGVEENRTDVDFGNYLPNCGNQFVDTFWGEVCEIGQSTPCADGAGYTGVKNCLSDCSGWRDCIVDTSCGDGIINDGETCDYGDGQNGQVCTPAYGGTCDYCDASCQIITETGPYCGDHEKNGAEECDNTDGTPEHNICQNDCTLEYQPYCGDQTVNGSEICELGQTQTCQDSEGYSGRQTCLSDCSGWGDCIVDTSCGDGIINDGETCDYGDGQNGQVCTPAYNSTCDYCGYDCRLATLIGPYCGDNIKNGLEECDGTDGVGSNQECQMCVLVNLPYCGDGIKNGSEDCDGADGTPEHYSCTLECILEYIPYCGDQTINQAEEECDGDAPENCVMQNGYNGTKTCGSDCLWGACQPVEFCGDQTVNGPEICEIGDTQACDPGGGYNGNQSCAGDCSGWGPCVPTEYCGDGILNDKEQCDGQAGLIDHHICTADCTLQYVPYCGDNTINQGSEQCDGDEPQICTTVDGYSGTQACAESCLWGNCLSNDYCGDNEKNGLEQCDGTDGVGANQSCTMCVLLDLPYCGDGAVNQASEQCDDGNNSSDDGCSAACQNENDVCVPGFVALLNPDFETPYVNPWQGFMSGTAGLGWTAYRVGTDIPAKLELQRISTPQHGGQYGELDGDESVRIWQTVSTWPGAQYRLQFYFSPRTNVADNHLIAKINSEIIYDQSASGVSKTDTDWQLGQHIFTADSDQIILEFVDGSVSDSYGTFVDNVSLEILSCQSGPVCGNEIIESGETCDDGNTNSGDGCSAACQLEQNGGVCGNGVVESGEECDDGNLVSGDGCSSTCQLDGSGGGPICGNNIIESGEECDDGNLVSGDGCSSTCQLDGSGGGPICGNNIIESGEECDDGNLVSGDGCSSTCQLDGSGGGPICGNNIIESGEECDDGNLVSGDGCNEICETENNTTLFSTNNFGSGLPASAPKSSLEPIVLGEEGLPVLSISKISAKDLVNPGDKNLSFTVTVANTGNLTAFSVNLRDILPDVMEYAEGGGQEKTWVIGDLAPGQSKTVEYAVNIKSDASAGEYENLAIASAFNHGEVKDSALVRVAKIEVLAASGFRINELGILLVLLAIGLGFAWQSRRRLAEISL